MKRRLKRSEKFRWVTGIFGWACMAYAVYQLNPLYFFAAVIPYMLVNWFSDEIDGES